MCLYTCRYYDRSDLHWIAVSLYGPYNIYVGVTNNRFRATEELYADLTPRWDDTGG